MGKRRGGDVDGKNKRLKSFTVLEPGWKGIFVTCARKKELGCRAELVPIVEDFIEKLYPSDLEEPEAAEGDIEDMIAQEVAALGEKKQKLCEGHLIGCECVIFIRVKRNVDPVRIVEELCKEAANPEGKCTRYAQKLTPVEDIVTASIENLTKFQPIVGEAFKEPGQKFAIRATVRNSQMVKEEVISSVARLVGHNHKVDLKNYDLLILVECFKSSIGLAVVGKSYDEYERYNLQQIVEKAAKRD